MPLAAFAPRLWWFGSGDWQPALSVPHRQKKRQGRLGIAEVRVAEDRASAKVAGMNAHAKDLLRDAMALPVDERAELAEELLASIDGDGESKIEAAWGAELEQRAR